MAKLKWDDEAAYSKIEMDVQGKLEEVGLKIERIAKSLAPVRRLRQREQRRGRGGTRNAGNKIVIYDVRAEKVLSDEQAIKLMTEEKLETTMSGKKSENLGLKIQRELAAMREEVVSRAGVDAGINEYLEDNPLTARRIGKLLNEAGYEFRIAVPMRSTSPGKTIKSQPGYQLLPNVRRGSAIAKGDFSIEGFEAHTKSDDTGQQKEVRSSIRGKASSGRGTGLAVLIPRMTTGGTLKKSIRAENVEETDDGYEVVVRANAPYAYYVEKGTKRHGKAQPFMMPALLEVKEDIMKMLVQKEER